MSTNKMIRKIHLVSSMFILSFLLMYLVTGLFMMNRNLFEIPPVKENQFKLLVEKPMEGAPELYGQYLKERLGTKGRIEYLKDGQENWLFHFNFPGDIYKVTLTPSQDTLYVQRSQQEQTLFMVLHGIHVLRGFKGGWAYTAWAVMYDMSCVAMLVFAVTGVVMWYRARRRFRYGLYYLASGILIPATIVCLYIFWK
ncbi:MAG: PepSY-associated TM helix domain-containing protein [Bacteroidales bacterium]|nr:PepSY-associated TM helix domain-containing protein [Bacteroidales bacterium]